ncbi:hypothetical protein Clacol_010098 [Clathrus columnatus]|uniref:Uncharacterized protein n=1 Tax=Clathrus columnatus TaxID=1419009 RepID=A0AAV5AVD8_9AGAM|nr:hypothetical protein Clacol_010098 [Clathrus columnatus]
MDNFWRYGINPRRVYTVNAPSTGNNEGRNTPVVPDLDPENPTQAVVLRPATNAAFFNHVSQVVPQSYMPQSYIAQSFAPYTPPPQTQNIPNFVNPGFVGTPIEYRNINTQQMQMSNDAPHFNSYVNMTNYNVNINMGNLHDVSRREAIAQGQIFEIPPNHSVEAEQEGPQHGAAAQPSSSTIAYPSPRNFEIVRRNPMPLPQSQVFEVPLINRPVERGRPELHGAVISSEASPPPVVYRSLVHSQRNFPGRREAIPSPKSQVFEMPPIDHFSEKEPEHGTAPQPTALPTIAHRSPTLSPRDLNIARGTEEISLPQSQVFEHPPIDHFIEQGGPEHYGVVISPKPSSSPAAYRSPTRSASPANSSIYYYSDCNTCESPGSGLPSGSPLTIFDPEFQPPTTLPSSPIVQPVPPVPINSLDNAVRPTPESSTPYGDLSAPDPDLELPSVISRKRTRPQSFKGRAKAPPLHPDEKNKTVRSTDHGTLRSRAIVRKYIPTLGGFCSLCPIKKSKRIRFGPRASDTRLLEHLVTQHLILPIKNMHEYNPEKLADYAAKTRGHLIETKEQFDYTRKYVNDVKCRLRTSDVCLSFREKATIEHLWKSHWSSDEIIRQEEKKRLDDLVPHPGDFYSLQDKFLYNFPFIDKGKVDNVQESESLGSGVSGPSERERDPENVHENVLDIDRSSDSRSEESTAEWFSEGEPDNTRKSVEWSSDLEDRNGKKPVDQTPNMGLNKFF